MKDSILASVKKVTPHIVFDDAPLCYLAPGSRNTGQMFAEALGHDLSMDNWFDPHGLTYQIVTPGGRLIGELICSDSFGVDLILEDFF